jgi:hypothetical protein
MDQKVNCTVINVDQGRSLHPKLTYSKVDVRSSISQFRPGEACVKNLSNGLVFDFFYRTIYSTLVVAASKIYQPNSHIHEASTSYQLFRKPLHVPSA